jgi:hypothetical protein
MQNIGQDLAVVHQKGSKANTRRIPGAEQVYLGKPKQVALMLGEVFECFAMKDVYGHTQRGDRPKSDRRAARSHSRVPSRTVLSGSRRW